MSELMPLLGQCMIEEIQKYINDHGFYDTSVPFKKINTETPVHSNKGCGYPVEFEGTQINMCVYIEPYVTMYDGENIDVVAEKFSKDIAEYYKKLLVPNLSLINTNDYDSLDDTVSERMIVTCQAKNNTESANKNAVQAISKSNDDLDVTFFIKAEAKNAQGSCMFGPVTEKMLGHEPTDKDWKTALNNTLAKSDIHVKVEETPDGVPNPVLVTDMNNFADYFYLQIDLRPIADAMSYNELFILPISAYCACMYGIPNDMSKANADRIRNEVYPVMAKEQETTSFHAYIYDRKSGDLKRYIPEA